ncbi:unnamed protein product [Durusdinium trenchii]|uniref:DUF202 domain-containing protein n=1 Tax=Durusdinium trenchii TaxID=1381693 RepID=A0ABP0R335_9DINO
MAQDGYMRIEEGGNPAAPASGSKGRKAHEHAKYHCNRTMINFGLSKQVPNKDSTARDHLANERTFLAWPRTGLALSGAGFGVIKFLPGVSTNLILGFFLIGVGICVLAFGALRYFDVMEALENGVFAIDTGGVLLVCGATAALVLIAPCPHRRMQLEKINEAR